jgi:hypothetical protein
MVRERSMRDRYERNDKGINSKVNQNATTLEQASHAVAQARQKIGGHLPSAKHFHRCRKCFQVEAAPHLRFPGHNPSPHVFIPRFQVQAQGIYPGCPHASEPFKLGRRFTLRLNR